MRRYNLITKLAVTAIILFGVNSYSNNQCSWLFSNVDVSLNTTRASITELRRGNPSEVLDIFRAIKNAEPGSTIRIFSRDANFHIIDGFNSVLLSLLVLKSSPKDNIAIEIYFDDWISSYTQNLRTLRYFKSLLQNNSGFKLFSFNRRSSDSDSFYVSVSPKGSSLTDPFLDSLARDSTRIKEANTHYLNEGDVSRITTEAEVFLENIYLREVGKEAPIEWDYMQILEKLSERRK